MADPRHRNVRSWREQPRASTPAARSASKRRQVFTLLVVLVFLVGALLAWVLIPRRLPSPHPLPIAVTAYKDFYLPVNARAEQDREALLEVFTQAKNLQAIQERDQVLQELNGLKDRPRHEAVVLSLSAHVVADEQGTLYLLPGDADVDRRDHWIRLQDVLEKLRDCPATHKLLILDVARPLAHPRLGVLANDMAERVEQLLDSVEDPHRLVLTACSPGQVALTSELLGHSVFGYYLRQGLSGRADGSSPAGGENGRVSVEELHRFVRDHVDRWARLNQGLRQTPRLFGAGRSFDLVLAPEDGTLEAEPAPTPYPKWLLEAWERHDRWLDTETYRLAPGAFRQMEGVLLRAEEHWRGGRPERAVQEELAKLLDPLEAQAEDVRKAAPAPRPRSLALEIALGRKSDEALDRKLRGLLEKLDQDLRRSAKPEEADKARGDLAEKFYADFKGSPFELAHAIFEAAADDPVPQPARVQLLAGLLQRKQPDPLYVETLFLQRLADLASQDRGTGSFWPRDQDTVRDAFRAVRDGERVAACDPRGAGRQEPRLLPWIRPALDAAAQKRHDAEVLLFSPGFAPPGRAGELFREAVADYRTIHDTQVIFEDAYRARDDAFARLPGFASYLLASPDLDARDLNDWKEAVDLARELHALLQADPNTTSGRAVHEVRQKADAVRDQLRLLARATADLGPQLEQVRKSEAADPVLHTRLSTLLALPWLRAKERKDLHDTRQALALRLLRKTRESEERTAPPGDLDTRREAEREQARAARRAEIGLTLLRLGGIQDLAKLEADVGQARTDPARATPALGQALRSALAEQVRKHLQDGSDPAAQERVARVFVAPHEIGLFRDGAANPSARLRRDQARVLGTWLGERFAYARQDLRELGDDRGGLAPEFYAVAAREYLPDARALPAVQFPAASTGAVNLRDGSRLAQLPMRLSVTGDAGARPVVDVATLADPDWLDVQLASGASRREGSGPFELAWRIALRPDATDAPRAPQGFLVRAVVNGRSFHHRVPVALPEPRNRRLQLLVSTGAKEAADPVSSVQLRAHTPQPFYVWVFNPTEQPRKVLVEVKAPESPSAELRATPLVVGPGKRERVVFPAAAPPPATAAPAKPAEPPELKGPLQLRLLEADNPGQAPLDQKTLPVSILPPQEYVAATVKYVPGGEAQPSKLTVRAELTRPIVGGPCPVEVVLSPALIPGFVEAKRQNLNEELRAPGQDLILTAEDLQFNDDLGDRNGLVAIHVDGYKRAFLYRLTFLRSGVPPAALLDTRRRLRLEGPEVARSGEPLPVVVEVDNPPAGATLEVSQESGSGPIRLDRYTPARQERITLTAAPEDGALLFRAAVEDRKLSLPTSGIRGAWTLRARLLQENTELATAQKTVRLDGTPPEGVRIVAVGKRSVPPKEIVLPQGGPVEVVAEGEDLESGIDAVHFFFGEPEKGSRPAASKPFVAQPLNPERTRWGARLPVPRTFDGLSIGVEFVNRVGLKEFDVVTVLPPPPPEPAPDTNKKEVPKNVDIAGVVVERDREQPGLKVTLSGEKGTKPVIVETDARGRFLFRDVAPGTYELSCEKPGSGGIRRARTALTVQPGKPVEPITLTLKL